jgi:hypothetical protein
LPYINYPFILVTHNSDLPSGKNQKILTNPYLLKWFGQNMSIFHEKTIGIPIGIQNSQWSGSDFSVLEKAKSTPKTKLVYFYFSTKTNPKRQNIFQALLKNGFQPSHKKPLQWKDYVNELSNYVFCFSPEGNGIDTHRIWECLYLNCVPIVKKNPVMFNWFRDLPILWVDNFGSVTMELLETKKNMFSKKWNLEKTTLSYWQKNISELITTTPSPT